MPKPKRNISDELFEFIKNNNPCSEEIIRKTLKLGSTNFRTNISKLLNNDSVTRIGSGIESTYVLQTQNPVQIVLDDITSNNLTSCTEIMGRLTLTRLQILKAVDALVDQKKIFRFKISTNNAIKYSVFQKNAGARPLDNINDKGIKPSSSTTFDDVTIDKTYLQSFLRGEMHLVK